MNIHLIRGLNGNAEITVGIGNNPMESAGNISTMTISPFSDCQTYAGSSINCLIPTLGSSENFVQLMYCMSILTSGKPGIVFNLNTKEERYPEVIKILEGCKNVVDKILGNNGAHNFNIISNKYKSTNDSNMEMFIVQCYPLANSFTRKAFGRYFEKDKIKAYNFVKNDDPSKRFIPFEIG